VPSARSRWMRVETSSNCPAMTSTSSMLRAYDRSPFFPFFRHASHPHRDCLYAPVISLSLSLFC
jgi:hypothetical protein